MGRGEFTEHSLPVGKVEFRRFARVRRGHVAPRAAGDVVDLTSLAKVSCTASSYDAYHFDGVLSSGPRVAPSFEGEFFKRVFKKIIRTAQANIWLQFCYLSKQRSSKIHADYWSRFFIRPIVLEPTLGNNSKLLASA